MMTGRKITNGLMVAVVAMGIVGLTVGSANAGTILFDDFSGGASSILGLAPDTRPGSEVWVGSSTGFRANGTHNQSSTAYLPFTPVAGKVYTLSADVGPGSSGNWSYFGFITNNPAGQNLRHDAMGSYGSILYYNTTTAGKNLITYYGVNGNGNLIHSGVCIAGVNKLKVVLDARDANSANWTMEFFLNGTSIRAAAQAATGNYGDIRYAGFNPIAGTLVGLVDNFLIDDDLTPPAGTVIIIR